METFKNFVIPLIQSWTLMSKEKGEKLIQYFGSTFIGTDSKEPRFHITDWNMSKQVVEDEEQVTNNYSCS